MKFLNKSLTKFNYKKVRDKKNLELFPCGNTPECYHNLNITKLIKFVNLSPVDNFIV